MKLMLSIAGGIVLGAIGLLIVVEWAQRRMRRGKSIASGVAQIVLFAAGACALVVGGIYGWSRLESAAQERKSEREWTHYSDSVAAAAAESTAFDAAVMHSIWCERWAGTFIDNNSCMMWWVDTAPPATVPSSVRQHARQRLADSLAADAEIASLDRLVSATALEPADVLPAWNRWAHEHPFSDHFGRFRAAALVGKACGLGQSSTSLKTLEGYNEWCFRSWWTDSTIFAATAIRAVRTRPLVADLDSLGEALGPAVAIYSGQATNQSGAYPLQARVKLTVHDSSANGRGYLRVFLPLGGSGPCSITDLAGNSIRIVSASVTGDTIVWTGTKSGSTMTGKYHITGGRAANEGGTWSLSRVDAGGA